MRDGAHFHGISTSELNRTPATSKLHNHTISGIALVLTSMRAGCGAVPSTSPCCTGSCLRLQPQHVRRRPRAAAAAPCRAADEGMAGAAAPPPAASAGARPGSGPSAAAASEDTAGSSARDEWSVNAGAAQRGTQLHATAERPQGAQQPHAATTELLGIPAELLPRHLAVIMDGNSRWAASRGRPAAAGYAAGVEALRTVVRCCHAWGIPCLTVSAPGLCFCLAGTRHIAGVLV